MKTFLYIFAIGFLFSCQGKNVSVKKKENSQQQVITVHANSQVEFEVEGMVCQMGCGGRIRKALKETCAVERIEVNYKDTLEEQTIKVYYNKAKISPQQMLHILANVNDKQFTVRTIGSPKKV